MRAMQQRQADALLHVFLYVGKGPDNRLPTNIRQRKAPGSGTSSSSHTPRSHADGFQVWSESSSEEEEFNDAEAEQTEAGPSLSGVHTPAARKRQRNSTDTHSGRQSRRTRHSNATDTSKKCPSKCGAFRQGSCHTTLSDGHQSLGGGHALWCTRVGLGFKELKLWYSDYEKTNGTPPSAQQLVQQPQMQHMAQWGAFQALKINLLYACDDVGNPAVTQWDKCKGPDFVINPCAASEILCCAHPGAIGSEGCMSPDGMRSYFVEQNKRQHCQPG